MFTLDHFPNVAPRYPDRVAAQVQRGTRRLEACRGIPHSIKITFVRPNAA
jgi:hypothetical protein